MPKKNENICANCRFFAETDFSTANRFNAPYVCTRTFDDDSVFPVVRIQPHMTCNHYVNKDTENVEEGSSEPNDDSEDCVVLSKEESLSILRAMNPKPEDRKWRDLLEYRISGYMPIHSTPMTGKLIIRNK